MSSVVLLPSCKLICDITLPLESSHTMARAVGDGGELTLPPVFEVRPFGEMPEDGITLVHVRSEDASVALLLLVLEGINMGPEAVEFPLQGSEIVGRVKVMAELSSNPLVPHVEG